MRKYIYLLVFFVIGTKLIAKPVSLQQAQNIAVLFYQHYAPNTKANTVVDVISNENKGVTMYYTFAFNTGGFVIVAADDAVIPVLAYSTERSFDKNNIPENTKSWLEQYSEQIKYIIDTKVDNTKTKQEWEKIENGQFNSEKSSVLPLCTTKWGQGCYCNELCPVDANSAVDLCGHVPTGCVATAMAQVMKYWNYPKMGIGYKEYTSNNYGLLSADFGTTQYQWDSMPDTLATYNHAVAELIYHCGVSVQMNYYYTGSSVNPEVIPYSLITNFGFKKTLLASMSDYTSNDWDNLLKSELNAHRPFIYGGQGPYGGHAFVCNGYDDNDKFYFNWGFNGSYNGYYAIGNLNPGGFANYTFNQNNKIIYKIYDATGIEETDDNSLQLNIFPNPVTDKLNIETITSPSKGTMPTGKQEYEIINSIGEIIFVSSIEKSAVVDMSNFPSGLYFVKLYTDKTVIVKKIMKQ